MNNTFRDIGLFVKFRGTRLFVEYALEPGQKEIVRADPDDCQEGFSPYVEVHKVSVAGQDITELLEDKLIDKIADAVLGEIKNDL